MFKTVQFRPRGTADPGCLNIFPEDGFVNEVAAKALGKGFVTSIDDPRIAPFKTLLDMISNHDETVRKYLINYIAAMVQRPSQIQRVCVILMGRAGTGKDLFWRFVGECILGKKFYVNIGANSERLLFGNFSKHMNNAILVHSEEVKLAVNKKYRDILYSMISSDGSVAESKSVDADSQEKYINYVMTTNSDTPLPIEQDDRRFVIFRVSRERESCVAENARWWKTFQSQLYDPAVCVAVSSFILNHNCDKFDSIGDRPITEAYREVKVATRSFFAQAMQRHVEGIEQSIRMETGEKGEGEGDDIIPVLQTAAAEALGERREVATVKFSKFKARDLQDALMKIIRELLTHNEGRGGLSLLNDSQFGKEMTPYVENGCVTKHRSNAGFVYTFNASACREYMLANHLWVAM